MLLTKFEHACFTVQNENHTLMVDPGDYTSDFIVPNDVLAVVITHLHNDHFAKDKLDAILAKNAGVVIISLAEVTNQLEGYPTKTVQPGESVSLPGFQLEFFGGTHAQIHPDIPAIGNLGILINQTIYYPGDSFTLPNKPVATLMLPVGAPWLKLGEVIDFARQVAPTRIIPTHDAVLSSIGKRLPDKLIPTLVPASAYQRLDDSPVQL